MSYDSFEVSASSGKVIELYEFRIQDTVTRLTSSENDVYLNSGSIRYAATAMRRSAREVKLGDPSSERLEIRMPSDEPFILQFFSIPPGDIASVTIFRIHRDDIGGAEEVRLEFSGDIHNISYVQEGREAVLQCLPITAATGRQIPRMTYQGLCAWMLYEAGCGINRDDPLYRFDSTVSAVSGDVITVTGASTFNVTFSDFFETGYVEFNGDYRTVVGQSGDDLTLILPFRSSPDGQSVIARAGCKLRIAEDCRDKFNNAERYGGFPYGPLINPFVSGLNVGGSSA
jgi:uncharacterized phage protein (TIGR02218 family)